MFYKMIERKRNQWLSSDECPVSELIDYIIKTGQMRDAQIEAIKTYLFLKIECECKPLEILFRSGKFNNIDLDSAELSQSTREYLNEHPEAAALLEYSCLENEHGDKLSEKLEKAIKKSPEEIDCHQFLGDVFYNVSYSDYLFSLPMGAGKTYLMAAFIYLDLYFAINEPANPAFAHNFIIFAPSGLKSSVIPSLKTIQKFNPAWIIPEPAATSIKRMMSFEVLDEAKSAKGSNKTKNPNAQKIASHQPLSELFGLVAVTNAEKVILDRIKETKGQVFLFEDSDDIKDKQANELRNIIGKLPHLSVFIDEVHHAVSDEIKLREVVNKWAANNMMNSVIGFSGTPYLDKTEKFKVTQNLSIGSAEISNIVYYYPLIDGIGNFLKRPVVKISDLTDSSHIIEKGVRAFLDEYKDTVYNGELTAKLGIYCGTIEKLEETVYPLVSKIASEYGLGTDTILKFHKGNKQYPQPADSQMQFDVLDKSISKIKIILLVQIGKEGWDCKSLTGIILSQEGDCPKNMVLQTSCRCLRQVVKGAPETALIYLNKSNGEKLNAQLQQQHHISIDEFTGADNGKLPLKRYDRTEYLKLPKVDFYQLKINYDTVIVDKASPTEAIQISADDAEIREGITVTTDFSMDKSKETITVDNDEYGNTPVTFNGWLYSIVKGSFDSLAMSELKPYDKELRSIFEKITFSNDSISFYSSKFNQDMIKANIRKAFCDKLDFHSSNEVIPEEASLLNIDNFTPVIYTDKPQSYYPEQEMAEKIIDDDKGKLKMNDKAKQLLEMAQEIGNDSLINEIKKQYSSHPQKDRSFHYLPYRTDSGFEQTFLQEILALEDIERLGLEVYYNGDKAMTEFKIKCYKHSGNKWSYVGRYTPDFLIIQRKDGKIHKAIIAETKGEAYAHDIKFKDKRTFMETEFIKQNNNAFGYERFDYLYLEDSLPEQGRLLIAHKKINEFFKET